MSFWGELKRRNVFRVGVAYLIASWLILQVIDVVAPILELPNWVSRAILLLLAVGFIVSLILAWAYELTPEGVKKEKDVDRSQSITPQTGRKLDFVIIGVLSVALAFFAFERFVWHDHGADAATDASTSENVAVTDDSTAGVPIEDAPRSIAVLPFANMSSDEEQQWFADGLTEEILNALARMPDLLVTARTSSFAYRNTQLDIPSIAAALGVDHILEGSVRRGRDQLRITAQLIRASDGFHLWSETFDRSPDDIIAIQEEIATQIARALNVALDPEALEEMVSAGTGSVPAFEAYLTGTGLLSEAFRSGDEYRALDARAAMEEAVSIDPEFARAHYGLFNFWRLQFDPLNITYGIAGTADDESRRLRDEHLARAIEYEHNDLAIHLYLSLQELLALDYDGALRHLERYRDELPLDANGLTGMLRLYRDMGLHDTTGEFIDQNREIILESAPASGAALNAVRYANDKEFVRRFVGDAMERHGDSANHAYQAHRALLYAGDIDGASALLAAIKATNLPEDNRIMAEMRQLCAENRIDEAARLQGIILDRFSDQLGAMWLSYMIMDDHDAARELLLPFDNDEGFAVLREFFAYGHFDPDEYPNLAAFLPGKGLDQRQVLELPYRCGR